MQYSTDDLVSWAIPIQGDPDLERKRVALRNLHFAAACSWKMQ